MDAKILRILRVIAILLAAILVLLTYALVGPKAGVAIFGVCVLSLPFALFPVTKS